MKSDRMHKMSLSPIALLRRVLRSRFSRDENGAMMVEFALLALPFFAIIGAILETAFFFLASQVLDSAVDTSVRLIRTGQVQQANLTSDQFRKTICDNLYNLFTCDNLKVDVKTITDFSSASFGYPLVKDADGNYNFVATKFYEPGAGSQVIAVRAAYKWPTLLDIMGFDLSNAGPGYRLLTSVRVFENEPFSNTSSTASSS